MKVLMRYYGWGKSPLYSSLFFVECLLGLPEFRGQHPYLFRSRAQASPHRASFPGDFQLSDVGFWIPVKPLFQLDGFIDLLVRDQLLFNRPVCDYLGRLFDPIFYCEYVVRGATLPPSITTIWSAHCTADGLCEINTTVIVPRSCWSA